MATVVGDQCLLTGRSRASSLIDKWWIAMSLD